MDPAAPYRRWRTSLKQGQLVRQGSSRMRARWTKASRIRDTLMPRKGAGRSTSGSSATSPLYDERVQQDSQRPRRILHEAGVSISGCLYEGERNAGNDVRRVGEEGLFEIVGRTSQPRRVSGKRSTIAIFTTDPHSLKHAAQRVSANTAFGEARLNHYTELLADLLARGVVSRCPLVRWRGSRHLPRSLAI